MRLTSPCGWNNAGGTVSCVAPSLRALRRAAQHAGASVLARRKANLALSLDGQQFEFFADENASSSTGANTSNTTNATAGQRARALRFTYLGPPPVVLGVAVLPGRGVHPGANSTPASGPTSGGTLISVRGMHFADTGLLRCAFRRHVARAGSNASGAASARRAAKPRLVLYGAHS